MFAMAHPSHRRQDVYYAPSGEFREGDAVPKTGLESFDGLRYELGRDFGDSRRGSLFGTGGGAQKLSRLGREFAGSCSLEVE